MKVRNSLSTIAIAAALLVFSIPLPAFSQMNMSMKGQQIMHMGTMENMGDIMGSCINNADKLGLTDDQLIKMKRLHNEMQKMQARAKADLTITEIEFTEIMEVKDFDLEKANATVKKIAEVKTAHHLEMLKAMKEMRTMLTDDQFTKMKKMMPMKTKVKKPAHRMMNKR